jgi:hypothetical protein
MPVMSIVKPLLLRLGSTISWRISDCLRCNATHSSVDLPPVAPRYEELYRPLLVINTRFEYLLTEG